MLSNELLIFITVAEEKNLFRAAEVQNLTQPDLSRHIQALEEYYGAVLFEKSGKGVELTPAGAALYTHAREILDLHRASRKAVADIVELVTGKLTIGASLTIGEYILPRMLAAFSQRYPKVNYSVIIGNTEFIHERALEGSIDFGLVEGHIEDKQLEVKEFLKDEMVLIVSKQHFLAKKKYVIREDLEAVTFVMREEGSGTRLALEEVLKEISLKPEKIITLGSTQAIKEAVEAGLGISFLSKWALRKELQLGTLKAVRVKDLNITRGFYLIRHKERLESKACSEFRRYILEVEIKELMG
ncbi:MAG: LysR family transcriptional regulator [Eubacteriales bacterium]